MSRRRQRVCDRVRLRFQSRVIKRDERKHILTQNAERKIKRCDCERRRFFSLSKLKRTLLLYAPYKFSTMRLCTLGSLKSRSICAFVRLLLPCNSSSSSSSSAKIRAVRNLSSMREDCGADFPPSVPEGFALRARRRRPIVSIILSSSSVRRFLRPERKREETLCRCRRPDLNASADLSQNCIYERE